MAGATLQPILNRLNGVPQYHPGSAETFADWTLEAGDIVRLKRKGQNFDTPVMVNTMRWNGQSKSMMEFDGQKERKAVSKVSKQKYGAGGGGLKTSKDLYRLEQNFDDLSGDFTQFVVGPTGIINSALWQGRDHVTAVAGDIEIVEDPTTHTKTMVVKSGGGIKIRRDNVEYGIYDNGNLTAGVIVSKINGGTTRISGKNVIIDGDTTINGTAIANSLEGKSIEAGYVNTQSGIGTEGSIYAYGNIGTDGDLYTGGSKVNLLDATVNETTGIVTITKADGSTINFKKARYDEGWSAANGMMSLPGSSTTETAITIKYPAATVDTQTSITYTMQSAIVDGTDSYVNLNNNSGASVARRNVGNVYTAGWSAAYGKVSLPAASTSVDAISVKTPASSVDGQNTTTFTMQNAVVDGSNSYVNLNNSAGATVARKSVGNVYNSGWSAAYGKVSLPGASTSSAAITVKTPSSGVGGQTTTTYTMQNAVVDGTNSYVNLNNSSGATVARKSVGNVYTAGVNAEAGRYHKVNDSSGRTTFTAYYYNSSGSLESMGSHSWYYRS